MLGDFRFLTSIKEYEKDSIPPQIMRKIRNEYLSNPLFVPAIVSKLSKAAGVLCRWIIALEKYDTIFKVCAPCYFYKRKLFYNDMKLFIIDFFEKCYFP